MHKLDRIYEISLISFKFHLGYMKLLLRPEYNLLAQLCLRLHEIYFVKKQIVNISPRYTVLNERMRNRVSDIKKLQFKNCILTCILQTMLFY